MCQMCFYKRSRRLMCQTFNLDAFSELKTRTFGIWTFRNYFQFHFVTPPGTPGWLQMAKREGTVHMSVLQQGNNRRKLHPAWPPRTGVGREWKAPGRAPDKALKRTETAIHVCTSPVGTAPPGSKCASQCLPALPRWVCSLKVWPMALGVGSINRQASGANAAAVRL